VVTSEAVAAAVAAAAATAWAEAVAVAAAATAWAEVAAVADRVFALMSPRGGDGGRAGSVELKYSGVEGHD